MELPPVRVELIADAKKFQTAMKQSEGSIDSLANKAEARSATLKRFGDKLASATIAAGAAVAVGSIKMAVDFETAITRLETGAGEAHKNIELVKNGILDMAGEVGKTPKQLAEGMYLIESAGFHGAAGLKVLKAAAQGAAVGGAEMATVADAVTTVLNNYNMSSDQAATATSGLIQTVALGKTNLQEFASSLGKVMPAGAALGLKVADISGAMATMTATGLKAELAAERLNAMMLGLATPTTEAAQILQYIGLTADQVKQSMSEKGLAGTLSMLEEHLGKKVPKGSAAYVDAMQQLTGGQTGYTASLMLTGSHMSTFKTNVDQITKTMGTATDKVKGFGTTQKTMQQQWDELKGTLQAGAIRIGEYLLPKAKELVAWAKDAIDYFKKHPLITKIATDAALAAFGIALGLKVKKAFGAVKDALGIGKEAAKSAAQTANTTALDLNTAAINRLTAVIAGEGGLPGVLPGGKTPGGGKVGKIGKVLGGLRGAGAALAGEGALAATGLAAAGGGLGALALIYGAEHPLQQLPPEFDQLKSGGRSRPDLQYAKLTKKYQDFRAAGGTDVQWETAHQAYIKQGHTQAEWLSGGARISKSKSNNKITVTVK